MLTEARSAIALTLLLSAAFGCGGDGQAAPPAHESASGGTPSLGTSSGSSGTSSGSSGSSGSSASSSSSSGGTATSDQRCTMPADVQGVGVPDAWLTKTAASTLLYVSVGASFVNATKTRRYRMTSASPCAFERDAAFGEPEGGDHLAADDAGNVFSLTTTGLKRVAPGAAITCTLQAGLVLSDVSDMTISADGSVGYVAYAAGGAGAKLAKITTGATACSVAAFPLTGGTALSGIRGVAIDGKGRVHVADDTVTGANKRMVIYDAGGAFVAAYDMRKGMKLRGPMGVTRCLSGMCVYDFFDPVAVTDDGAFVSEHAFKTQVGLNFPVLVGVPGGPLFVVGSTTPGTISIAVQSVAGP